MTLGHLIRRSLFFYWRTGLVVVFGLAVATAITTGALLIGDSVTGSLRDTALARLGRIDYALVAPHYFRAALADDLSESSGLYGRPQRIVPLVIAGLIITLSFLMRGQMLEALSGNWVPLGQFLVLVQAISSFDMRTRGGLYTGIVFSGIVLFFASQQAFDAGFTIFIIGFMVLLLAFLSVSFLEDGVRSAQVHWRRGQPSILIFWVSAACAVFLLAGLAFWVMPRGQTSLGLPDVAILPFSSNSLDSSTAMPSVDPASIPLEPDLEQPLPGENALSGPRSSGPS